MDDKKIKDMVYMALLAALVCVATFTIKIPSVVTNGYTHIGDGFIFIAVVLLGGKKGALAGAVGAALADLLAGYAHWALPTFIIKAVMGLVMGYVINKSQTQNKNSWAIGALMGSLWQVCAYYVVGSLMIGNFITSLADIPTNILQSAIGIVVVFAFLKVFRGTPIFKKLVNNK